MLSCVLYHGRRSTWLRGTLLRVTWANSGSPHVMYQFNKRPGACLLNPELAESWEYLMLMGICWNFGAIKIYLEKLEHMAS